MNSFLSLLLLIYISSTVSGWLCQNARSRSSARSSLFMARRATPSREYQVGGTRGKKKPPPINQHIRAGTVRVIAPKENDEEDAPPGAEEMLGIFPIEKAQVSREELIFGWQFLYLYLLLRYPMVGDSWNCDVDLPYPRLS